MIFFEVSVLMFGFGVQNINSNILHYALLLVLILISTWVYFRGRKVKKGLGEGFFLGLSYVVVGVILDSIITVPLFVKNYVSFFVSWGMLIGFIETILVTIIVGALKK